jgi:hypothetical protein
MEFKGVLEPSHSILFTHNQIRSWIDQIAQGILQIDRNKGRTQAESSQRLEDIVKNMTGNRFTCIAGNEKGNKEDAVTDRMITMQHIPHPVHPTRFIRGCNFHHDDANVVDQHLKEAHGMNDNQINNRIMEAVVKLYGYKLVFKGEKKEWKNGREIKSPIFYTL